MVLQPKKILIVDDHPDFREMLTMFIKKHYKDVSVKQAGTAKEGVKTAERVKPDVALMDIHLPDISGLQAAQEISRRLPDCQIITMSMFKDKQTFVTREVAAFIEKDELTSRLIPLLDKFFRNRMEKEVSHDDTDRNCRGGCSELLGKPA